MTAVTLQQRNRRVALIVGALVAAMVGLGYASVPLYRIFCQTTGFGGTTMRVTEAQAATVKPTTKDIRIRFDANVERGMPWQFKPVQAIDTVAIGVRDMAVFTAKNLSNRPITGTASFNVEPEQAARYFNKIQCFCFTEQTLKPGEEVRMPVIYYVDPKILDDPDNKDVGEITLSYTFHVAADSPSNGAPNNAGADAKALDRAKTGG